MSKCKHLFLLFTLFLFTGLSLNSYAGPVPVPDVTNKTVAVATTEIEGVGLAVGASTNESHATIPSGSVIRTTPAAGTPVDIGSSVDLVVSTGPAQVAVPNITGLTETAANSAITGAGLAVGNTTTANSGTVPAGDVISQSPIAGTMVNPGSTVDKVLSLGPAQVAVPNVVGDTETAAATKITGANLVVGTKTPQSSGTVPAGSVISQDPAATTMVNVGSAVNLVISSGTAPPAQVAVPNVVGDPEATATTKINDAGLAVGTKTNQSSDTVPVGDVISQNPAAGVMVNVGSAVNLVISTGTAPPAQVAVPNVVGDPEATAASKITAANLVVGTRTNQSSDTVPAGNVISQNPTAGVMVDEGSAVNLVISTGATPPAQVPVPNVVGDTEATATTKITSAGLVVGVVTNMNSDTVAAGNVISQDPAAGINVDTGSAVNLVLSLGPAIPGKTTVPEVAGLTEAAATTAIGDANLVTASTEANSDSVPAGKVISQTPPGGTTVDTGTTVDIVVSTGRAPVTVPAVVGQTEAEATSAIESADLVAKSTTAGSETVPVGDVISQDPAGGSSVPAGSTVTIVISTGLQSVEVPLAGSGGTVTITTAAGEEISNVSTAEASGGPSGINFPFGTIAYTTTSAVGGSVTMRFEFSSDLPADLVVYKVDNNGVYSELPTAIWTQIDARTVDVIVTDGDALTDHDGAANGSIEDPIAVGGVQSTGGGGDDDDDGDLFDFGGGGCTISNTQSASMDPIWLLMLLVPGLGVLRRRVAATSNATRGRN